MKIIKSLLLLFLFVPLLVQGSDAANMPAAPLTIHHNLRITLNPQHNEIKIKDTLTIPDNGKSAFSIQLNELFHLRYKKRPLHPTHTQNGTSSYHLALDDTRMIELSYKATLDSTEDCAWLKQACVKLDKGGVFLDGNSHWYPHIQGALHRFDMTVKLPKKWVSLSQGQQTKKGWKENQPQRALYLVAGPFHVYESQPKADQPKAMVYLQHDDPKLAQRYLDTTHQYIEQYSRMLGAYPYAKFATVESFWETGWGMPSFTLLGPKVMRLPFILHSSFPHEILHNWWGNGVYVDNSAGNWSEGLTAYLADHRNKPNNAQRIAYRRDTLQKFKAFTTEGSDFALNKFTSRHDRTTQAIGYGKSLMFFHMLRKRLGDKPFFSGLKQLYQNHQFRFASFKAVQQAFETASGSKLDTFFKQWLERTGAPKLEVAGYTIKKPFLSFLTGDSLTVNLTLKQAQLGKPYSLDIPLKIQNAKGNINHQTLHMHQAEQTFTLELATTTQKLMIDPNFDVFRLPDHREAPPALNTLFSHPSKTFVLARKVSENMDAAWKNFVGTLMHRQPNMPANKSVQYDDEARPDTGTVVVLGGDNIMLPDLLEHAKQPLTLSNTTYTINGVQYARNSHTLALSLQVGEQQIILLDAGTPESLASLARKLPHYGKYSYVLFDSVTGKNVAKGQWNVTDSPLTVQLGSKH